MYYIKNIVLLSVLLFSGCGETEVFTTGASIGGSGIPVSGGETGTILPIPSEDDDTDYEDRYIVWSNGKVDTICSDVRVSMQLLHTQTEQPLEEGQGTFISKATDSEPTNVSVGVTIENLSQYPLYEHFSECHSNLKLQNESGLDLKSNQSVSCQGSTATLKFNPLEIKQYQYKISLPLENLQRKIIFTPNFSFMEILPESERLTCDPLSYGIKLELY